MSERVKTEKVIGEIQTRLNDLRAQVAAGEDQVHVVAVFDASPDEDGDFTVLARTSIYFNMQLVSAILRDLPREDAATVMASYISDNISGMQAEEATQH